MNQTPKPILGANNFDFIRFALASLVVLSHSYPLATGTEEHEPLAVLTGRQLTFGGLAVDCFFILSGFLITQSWVSRPNALSFLSKRIRRIYPGFIVASALGTFLIWPLFSNGGFAAITSDVVMTFIGRTARLLDSVPGPAFPSNPAPGAVNGSLWSIAFEFWCYIGVLGCGLLGWVGRRRLLWIATVGAICISLAFTLTHFNPGGGVLGRIFGYPPFWARLLPFFIVGMAFNASRREIPLNGKGALLCVAALVVGALVPHGMIVVLPFAAAYLLFWAATLPAPAISRFAKHGDFSYGMYLYAFPIQQIVASWLGRSDPWALFAISWSLTLVAAFLSWHLIERRFVAHPGVTHGRPSGLTNPQRA